MPNLKTLKKIAMTSAIAAPTALGLGMSAQAITFNGPTQPADPFSIEVGGSFLTDSGARNQTTDTGFHVGLDYNLVKGAASSQATPSIDLDYDNNDGHGNHLYTYDAFYSYRVNLSQNTASSFKPYVGAGIGVAYIQGRKTVSSTTGVAPSQVTTISQSSHTATNFAYKFMAGVNFGQVYGEVAYVINGKDQGITDNFIDASIGLHF